MRRIVECIPNFSEGRAADKIKQIVDVIASVPGVLVLDEEMDAAHNRSVITFAGDPEAVAEAATKAVGKACQLIDLRKHSGEHPRIGATDVVPFVPISGVTMDDCVRLAEQVGQEIAKAYRIPVYLYEEAARKPERRDLAYIRRGEFEGLIAAIETDPDREPDFGPAKIHPTAGATVVGARPPLIAYNVYLNTDRVEVAKDIAKAVRHSNGGLRYVKALGFEIKERKQAQVSMNLTNFDGTPIFRAFELVKQEAKRCGTVPIASEIIGLVPQRALNQCAEYYLQLEKFSENQILERRLETAVSESRSSCASFRNSTLEDFAQAVAKGGATPGGGTVAAFAGTLAASLGLMVCELTVGKSKDAAFETKVRGISKELELFEYRLLSLADEDSRAFNAVLEAYALPKTNPDHRRSRIDESLRKATEVPLRTAETAFEVLKLLERLIPICKESTVSDLAVGAQMAHASIKGACYNVRINLASLSDSDFKTDSENRMLKLLSSLTGIYQEIETSVDRCLSR